MAVPEHWMFSGFNETPDERIGWLEQEVIKARAEVERLREENADLREKLLRQTLNINRDVERLLRSGRDLKAEVERLREFAEWCSRIEGWRFQQVVDYARRALDA